MRGIAFALIFACLLVSAGAHAATVRYAGLDDLMRDSDLVFWGTVTDVKSVDLSKRPQAPRIVTEVTFELHRVLKGKSPGDTFTLTMPGGATDGFVLDIPGVPRFQPGDEVILFLEWTEAGWTVCGMNQGRYKVHKDEKGRKWASRSFLGLDFPKARQEEPPVLLEDLLLKIKELKAK